MNRPKTIQIFLPDGSARSIKIAEITNRVVQAILVPRTKIKDVGKRNEVSNVGVYFLFGESEDSAKPLVYIGEAEDCYDRLKQHQKKEFWNTAVIVVSKTSSLTKAHVKFLENYCVSKSLEIGRYDVQNASTPTKSHITEQMEADLMDMFDDMKILLSTLGYPLLEEVRVDVRDKKLLICKGKDAYAKGEYTTDGLVVLKGSKANLEESKTVGTGTTRMREKLIMNGILVKNGKVLEFASDYIFSSPSAAAGTILARASNGWTEWKNEKGVTLDELERK